MCQFRGITNQIGRFEGLDIPFDINLSAYADYCSFYQLSDIDNEKTEIVLSKIDDQTIESGTPVLVRHTCKHRVLQVRRYSFFNFIAAIGLLCPFSAPYVRLKFSRSSLAEPRGKNERCTSAAHVLSTRTLYSLTNEDLRPNSDKVLEWIKRKRR